MTIGSPSFAAFAEHVGDEAPLGRAPHVDGGCREVQLEPNELATTAPMTELLNRRGLQRVHREEADEPIRILGDFGCRELVLPPSPEGDIRKMRPSDARP